MTKMKIILINTMALMLNACSTPKKVFDLEIKKVVINKSTDDETKIPWVKESKTSWEDNTRIYFKTQYTINGTQRLNSCFDLAKVELKETVISEVSSKINSEINFASQDTDESSEPILSKSMNQTLFGNIKGLRVIENYYERYMIGDTQKLDCFILASMKKEDFAVLKASIFREKNSVNKNVVEVIDKRQEEFFKSNNNN